MNGRCETDPFDRAVDICRICYGEFCWTCLVETKGRSQPMCRECALIVGGLRPKAKPRIRGSKKTVKARREALREAREAPRHHGANFTFFDVGDDHSFVGFQDLGSSRARPEPEPASDVPPPEVQESPAVQRLDSIRRADRQGSPESDQVIHDGPAVPTAASPPPPLPDQTPMPNTADGEQFTLETYTPEPVDQNPVASKPAMDQTAPAAYQPSPGLTGTAPIGHEPPPPTSAPPPPVPSSNDAFEEEMPVGYAPPPWEALAAPSDLAQMKPASAGSSEDNANAAHADEDSDSDDLNFDEPAEFRKPRPFVTAAQPAAVSTAPAAPATPPAKAPTETGHVDRTDRAQTTAVTPPAAGDGKPEPIHGQPNANPPAEFAIASVGRSEPDEPVHIHDDPWARTGPEVVSTAPLPRRRPDPKPSEDQSTSPPDWTKAKLPKFD